MKTFHQSPRILCVIAAFLHSASSLQLGVPIDPASFPNIPHIDTPSIPPPQTDFLAIEAAIVAASETKSGAKASHSNAAGLDTQTPIGYDLIFGPITAATGASGFMGSTLISEYSVTSCAELCNSRAPDANGGACQFFNIWLTTVNNTQQTTCAFYFIPTDGSTATNKGTSALKISESRGYTRVTLIQDGGFEGWNCTACCTAPFCSTRSYFAWEVLPLPGFTTLDGVTTILRLTGAHTGFDFATLGCFDTPQNPGILQPVAQPLQTIAGQKYLITFFHQARSNNGDGTFSSQFKVLWNGNVVFTITGPLPDLNWRYYQVKITAVGGDKVGFEDTFQNVSPASAIDDVFLLIDN
ncbi:hypothetical protein BDN70DRAFT_998689 [Pholiota conissans]|uniref:Uncharacterized protein n=1 Tax=Pholiota conissans TaxID=109636 RepID=A0A9P6CM13_9AGAR|nr:hypothetical protein BDN70DRAFT_998689 [Pholiota conissans]